MAIIENSFVKMLLLLFLIGNFTVMAYAQNEVQDIEYITFVENYQESNSNVVFPIVSKARRSTSSDALEIHKIYETDMPDSLNLCIDAAIDLWRKSLEDTGISLIISFSYVEIENDIETSVPYIKGEVYSPASLAKRLGTYVGYEGKPDAYVRINKNTKWVCNHSADVANNGINLTNAILRSISVALGFGSSVVENPKQPLTVKFFNSKGHSNFDNMLVSADGSMMANIPNMGSRFNQELTNFVLGNKGEVYALKSSKEEYKMYTPSSYEPGKSLVYLDNDASLMNWDMSVASKNLQIDDVTKNILKALGWSPVQRKEDVKIIGRDIDSTGLASSYIGHEFYIGGADANFLANISWKYILPSVDGTENVVIQKNDAKEFSIPQIDDVNKYQININGDIYAKIVLEGEVRGQKISRVYNLTLELKPRIKKVEIVRIVSNLPKYDSYDVYYNVEYSGSDELFVAVEEEYGSAIVSQIVKEPFYAHVKSTNITAPYYAWIDISVENKYGKDVYTLEIPPYGTRSNKYGGIQSMQLKGNLFVVRDWNGDHKKKVNSIDDLHNLPSGVYLVDVYVGNFKIKTIKYYKR